ncbi:hypothetical protein R83H12_02871 [Fibrobacteria bacterium R8-3-H12]
MFEMDYGEFKGLDEAHLKSYVKLKEIEAGKFKEEFKCLLLFVLTLALLVTLFLCIFCDKCNLKSNYCCNNAN